MHLQLRLFICGEADRSGRGKHCSCCCCCWGGDHFQMSHVQFFEVWKEKIFFLFSQKVFLFSHPFSKDIPCTVFWGVKRQKLCLKKGCEKAKTLSQKGCEKAKTLSQKVCEKAKTLSLSHKGCEKAKTLSQEGHEKAKTLSKTVIIEHWFVKNTIFHAADQWKYPFLVFSSSTLFHHVAMSFKKRLSTTHLRYPTHIQQDRKENISCNFLIGAGGGWYARVYCTVQRGILIVVFPSSAQRWETMGFLVVAEGGP